MIGRLIARVVMAAPLLLLFFVAFNFVGSVFWFVGFFILLAALVHLAKELPKKDRRVPLIVVALATIALFFGACGNHARALGELSRETKAFALDVHARCGKERVCPDNATVCTPGAYACREAGSLGIALPIRYRLADDKRSFSVSSSMSGDDSTSYQGGVDRALIRKTWMDGESSEESERNATVIVPFDAGTLP